MTNPHQQQLDGASFGPFRKQLCRKDTWEEVVRKQLKRDWFMNWMKWSLPFPIRCMKITHGIKKHISDEIALQNLVNKRKKDAIYVRNDYEHHFPQMGEILKLFKKSTHISVITNKTHICHVYASIGPTTLLWKQPIHMFIILAIPFFSCYSEGGEKSMENNVPCTLIFMI